MKRLSALGLAKFAGLIALPIADYRRWRGALRRRLESGSQVMTTAQGDVEYAAGGRGPAVLIAHGMSGGYDQARLLSQVLGLEGRVRLVLPSRPGYLRTPLESGRSPADQADLFAAVLDALDIERAAVIGFSGGGPSALQFALRHPERCSALVLISALTHPFERSRLTFMQRLLGLVVTWVRRAPVSTWLVSRLLLLSGFSIAGNDSGGRAITRALWDSILPGRARLAGVRNDDAQWDVMHVYDLAKIQSPTLVVHGDADTTVRPEMGRYAADAIPAASLVKIPGGTHLAAFRRRAEVATVVGRFLQAHA